MRIGNVIFKDEVGAAFEFVCSDADVSMKLFLKKGIRPKYFNRALLLTILRDKFENFTFLIDEMKMEVNFEFPKYLFGPHDCLYYEKAQDGGTPLALAASRDFDIKTPPVAYVRYLLCRGAKIDENAIKRIRLILGGRSCIGTHRDSRQDLRLRSALLKCESGDSNDLSRTASKKLHWYLSSVQYTPFLHFLSRYFHGIWF